MSNRELVDVAFLTVVLVVLVGSFIYINAFYEEAEEEEEEESGEDDAEITESFHDSMVDVYASIGETLPEHSVLHV